MSVLLSALNSLPEYPILLKTLKKGRSAAVTGIGQINRTHLIAGLRQDLSAPMVVLCQDDMAAKRLQEELKDFLGRAPAILPARELTLYDAAAVSREWEQKRLAALYNLASGKEDLQIWPCAPCRKRFFFRRCSPWSWERTIPWTICWSG